MVKPKAPKAIKPRGKKVRMDLYLAQIIKLLLKSNIAQK